MQQKKVGDSPSYEHLSRPYLEKMKFLDGFIQPRKSYRHVGHLFSSPTMSMKMLDGNESSKSNSSIQMLGATGEGGHLNMKNGFDESFQAQYYQNLNQQFAQSPLVIKNERDTDTPNQPDLLRSDLHHNMPSSSSSIVSQESPATIVSNSTTTEIDDLQNDDRKRRRTSIMENNSVSLHINSLSQLQSPSQQRHSHHAQSQSINLSDNDEHSSINNDDVASSNQSPSVPSDFLFPSFYQHTAAAAAARLRKSEHVDPSTASFPSPSDFLHPLSIYQQQASRQQVRNSEQLLGELVTSELVKMSKERKKIVQKKILEILFFDD